nr:Fanconi anemia core complex-associated protein 24 [Anolis sagrei ordinatus]
MANHVCAGAVNVPHGHVIGNEKWKGSQIAQSIQGKVKLILEGGLGIVDFHLPNRSCVLYVSEADLVAGNGYKRRLVCFRNVSTFCVKYLLFRVFVPSPSAKTVAHLPCLDPKQVFEQMKDRLSNPFLTKKSPKLLESSIIQTVQQIPGVGKAKALLLLERFRNLHQLCNASVSDLEEVVGRSLAQQIHTFFTG